MKRKRTALFSLTAAATAVAVGLTTAPVFAYTSVATRQGDQWNVNDAAIPGLDTGSVRSTTASALLGYGGLRMRVSGGKGMLNGALLRGFGITSDGAGALTSKHTVVIDGVAVKRELTIDKPDSYGRFFDTFTNTTGKPIGIDVAFGGQLGYNTGTNQSAIASTSSGDTRITGADGWASWYTPSAGAGSASANGPSATTIGTPGYAGALQRTGNFLRDPFTNPLATTGDEANHPGLVNRIVLAPGQSRSVAHFVVTGLSETRNAPDSSGTPAAGTQVRTVQQTAADLTAKPDFAGLSAAQICSLDNYSPQALAQAAGTSALACTVSRSKPLPGAVIAPVTQPTLKTTSPYNVVGKTVVQLKADLASGRTTTQQVVQAYLDRIAAYDQGPLGLHSVLTVAPDALAQAKAGPVAASNVPGCSGRPRRLRRETAQNARPPRFTWVAAHHAAEIARESTGATMPKLLLGESQRRRLDLGRLAAGGIDRRVYLRATDLVLLGFDVVLGGDCLHV
ncbi:hypothetical protein BJ973_000242 [Actinoplanes tereljensis]|uniref:PBP domain-containing protein n=1 Tax=Paractinoplanes tereljensis TaxID=571912 RepID=A0A919NSE5_9ACTN|nr:hypothetical protein [Actinoplanes tereljensis]GIF23400.1 hypothetical protein Ate02nite_61300 [Actinoplanes tereljensis]